MFKYLIYKFLNLWFYKIIINADVKTNSIEKIMKIRLFNFIKRKPSRNINYNPPLKNIKSIPSNLLKKQEPTTGELLIEITEQIKKILANIDKKDKEILAQLKKISGK